MTAPTQHHSAVVMSRVRCSVPPQLPCRQVYLNLPSRTNLESSILGAIHKPAWNGCGLQEEDLLKKVPIIVFANKQDLEGSLTPHEIAEGLGLFAMRERAWQIEGCSAKEGIGLEQGMDWLMKQIS
jgi:ADP-ribosylation factor family